MLPILPFPLPLPCPLHKISGRRLLSATALSSCAVHSMMGTSMSTPAVSGAVAIVRQYFTDGWYPTGRKVSSNSFLPSGALLKAAIINSAVPMKSYRFGNNTLLPLGLPPDAYQGFGRVKLDELLPVGDSVDLWLNDHAGIATGE